MTAQEVNYPNNVAIVSTEQEWLMRQFTMAHNVVLLPRVIPLQEEFVKMASALRIFAQQKFESQRKYIGHELHPEVYVGDRDDPYWNTKNGSMISWDSFDMFLKKQKNASFMTAAKFVKADSKIFKSAQLRVHWQVETVDKYEHPDLSDDIEFGRALTCYTEPTTKGWRIDQQVKKPDGYQVLRTEEDNNFFAFRRGDLWRHACGNIFGDVDIDFSVPFIHQSSMPKHGIPRMLLLGDKPNQNTESAPTAGVRN